MCVTSLHNSARFFPAAALLALALWSPAAHAVTALPQQTAVVRSVAYDGQNCSLLPTAEARMVCKDSALIEEYARALTSNAHSGPSSILPDAIEEQNASDENQPISLLASSLKNKTEIRRKRNGARVDVRRADNREMPLRSAGVTRQKAKSEAFAPAEAATATPTATARRDSSARQPGNFAPLPKRYVALGDFSSPEKASEVVEAFSLWEPRVQHVYIRGRHHSRVLVGPFSDKEISDVQQHLRNHGFDKAWPLRTTANATPETLIARYPGDG